MRAHVLAVTEEAARFGGLLRACADAGERAAWIDLRAPSGGDPDLASAAEAGALRAIAAGEGRVQVVKRLRGAPVLADLIREHCAGCRLVLVRGADGLPRLDPDGDGWRIEEAGKAARKRTTEEMVAGLRRKRI